MNIVTKGMGMNQALILQGFGGDIPTAYVIDEIDTYIRYLIGEPVAKNWADNEISLYKGVGMMMVESKYWYLLAPLVAKAETVSLRANIDYVNIPDLCAKVLMVEETVTKGVLRKIEVNELWKYAPYDDGSAATNYLRIHYFKHRTEAEDFLPALHGLIAIEAAICAKVKEGGDRNLEALRDSHEEQVLNYLSVADRQEPDIMSGYDLADRYTSSNPCAWIYRNNKIHLLKNA